MTIERHEIQSEEQWHALRQSDVTASTAAALLGIHPYCTALELWAEKTGAVDRVAEETPAMRRGRRLEPVAVDILREERPGWQIERPNVYLRDPAARLGATPDVFAIDPERGPGNVQIKTVDPHAFRQSWRDPETGDIEAPLWIAVQAIIEAHLAGAEWTAIAAMVVGGGLDMIIVPVPIHDGVLKRVRQAVDDFWTLIDEGGRPPSDYTRDAAIISRLYASGEGEPIDLTDSNRLPALVAERAELSESKRDADKRLKEINAEIFEALGDAQSATIQGGLITARVQHRKEYVAKASSFRVIRFKADKEKAP